MGNEAAAPPGAALRVIYEAEVNHPVSSVKVHDEAVTFLYHWPLMRDVS